MSICVGVAGSKAQFKRHRGGSKGGETGTEMERKGRESLDIIEGDNLRRQMGRNRARGEQMDGRNDGRGETPDTDRQGRCERLRG